jgi:hypothetical protein
MLCGAQAGARSSSPLRLLADISGGPRGARPFKRPLDQSVFSARCGQLKRRWHFRLSRTEFASIRAEGLPARDYQWVTARTVLGRAPNSPVSPRLFREWRQQCRLRLSQWRERRRPEPRVMCATALTARGFLAILADRHC